MIDQKTSGFPTREPRTSPRLYTLLVIAALILVTYTGFAQVTQHDFIGFDDPTYVTENVHVRAGFTLQGVLWALRTTAADNWHPLTWMSHMLDCTLYGLNAGGHHLTNLLLHLGNTLLLFLILLRMTGAMARSAFVAALFALHPLHVESVAWVTERKDVLSTCFWFLTMWAYVRYTEQPGWGRYSLVCLSLALGLMAKPMLVTLPCVLLLLDYWPLGRLPARFHRTMAWRLVREKLPLFVLAALSSWVTVVVQQHGGAVKALTGDFTLSNRLANACVAYVQYLIKTIWPYSLAVFYPYPGRLPLWQVGGAVIVLGGLSILLLRAAKSRPYLPVGWLWFLGTLVPVIGLVQVGKQALADRYTYVPLVGIFLLISWGIPDLLARWRYRTQSLTVLGGGVLLFLMLVTRQQVGYWQNTLSLFTHALAVTDANYVAHMHVGMALAKQGQAAEAIAQYQAALTIVPGLHDAYMQLGLLLDKLGRHAEAIALYKKILRDIPDHDRAHANLAHSLAQQGRDEEAIAHLQIALRSNPTSWITHYNLGVLLLRRGEVEEALTHYLEALRLNPYSVDIRVNLGMALLGGGLVAEATRQCQEAVRLAPALAQAHYCVGLSALEAGDQAAATQVYERLRLLAPDLAAALLDRMHAPGKHH